MVPRIAVLKDEPEARLVYLEAAEGQFGTPNNWAQILGEANSTWTYNTETAEYYLSIFTSEQPDPNWENPEVRAAVYDVMHFRMWCGVPGFRMGVSNMIRRTHGFRMRIRRSTKVISTSLDRSTL
jgi:glycosidase